MLETEIKKLSSQIEQLNNNFEAFFSSATQSAPVETPKTDSAQLEEPKQETTADDVRGLCLTKCRADKANKAKVKAILSKYGAKVVDDLSSDDLQKAKEEIGAL